MMTRRVVAAGVLGGAAILVAVLVVSDRIAEPPGGAEVETSASPQPRLETPMFECSARYLPLQVGYRATYRTTVPGIDGELRTEVSLASIQHEPHRVRARFEISFDGHAAGELVRDCDRRGLGDPWSGFMPGLESLVQGDEVWRFPLDLSPGQHFEGATELDLDPSAPEATSIRMERRFDVCCEEDVDVPAGRFTALRIDVVEHGSGMETEESRDGSIWLARDVGLVRSEMTGTAGDTQIQELVEVVER